MDWKYVAELRMVNLEKMTEENAKLRDSIEKHLQNNSALTQRIAELENETNRLRRLLERVIDEGWLAWSIKSVSSPSSDLESHWCISNELMHDIKKEVSNVENDN